MERVKRITILLLEYISRQRKAIVAFSCIVVFITTYLLILPGFTLEKDKAIELGGIDVETEEAVETEIEDVDDSWQAEEGDRESDSKAVAADSKSTTESEADSIQKQEKTVDENAADDVDTKSSTEVANSGSWHGQSFIQRKSKGWTGFKAPQLTSEGSGGPEATKTLEPNGDGTYTLTLSVKSPSSSTSSSNKANIVIIYDSSNSMNEAGSADAQYVQDDEGSYFYYKSEEDHYEGYFPIGYNPLIKKFFIKVPSSIAISGTATEIININDVSKRYKLVPTRMDVAKARVRELTESLLANNSSANPDAVEIGFVEFGTKVFHIEQSSTNKETINNWIERCDTYARSELDAAHKLGGTNWDAALRAADKIDFGDDDPTYIIFISDGNPTARLTEIGEDGDRIGQGLIPTGIVVDEASGLEVFGNGNTDPERYNFQCAEEIANRIKSKGKILYNIGIFGDADVMADLPNDGYFDGADSESIKTAFNDIVGNISSQVGYKDVKVTDGITSMTSTAIVGHGRASDFTYRLNGEEVTEAPWMTASFDDPVNDPANGQYESGRIHWNLGEDYILEDGATYSVSCIVWPNQRSYDLVADLNNGTINIGDLTPEEQSQFEKKNGIYVLKTNTVANASFTKTDTGTVTTLPLDPPDPMPLEDSKVTVQKVWSDSLAQSEYDEIMADNDFHVWLNLMKGGTDYLDGPVIISKPEDHSSRIWPENDPDGHHISTGLMVSKTAAERSGLYDGIKEGFDTCTYKGETYYILDPGYDYYFEEHDDSDKDYHFELENKVFHPMVVDGVKKDVAFDGNEVTDMVNLNTLTVTNSLKGGINLNKIIVDAEGKEITDMNTQFTIHGSFSPGVRLEYRKIGDEYTDETGASGRSEKFYIEASQSGSFDIQLYGGDSIRFVNVPSGHSYSFCEVLPDGSIYSLINAEGEIKFKKDDNPEEYDESKTESMTVTGEGSDRTVSSTTRTNAEQNVTFTNQKPVGSIEITKNVTVDGSPTTGTEADGDYFFEITDTEGNPVTGKVEGNTVTDGMVKITVTNGQASAVTITDVPSGTYTVNEVVPNNGTELDKIDNIDVSTTTSKDITVEANKTTNVKFTNDKSSTVIDEYTSHTVEKKWLDKDGNELNANDVADKTIKYKITQKRAVVTGSNVSYPVVIKLFNYDGSLHTTKTYYVKYQAVPIVRATKSDSDKNPVTLNKYWTRYNNTYTAKPDSNSGYKRVTFQGIGGIVSDTLVEIRPSNSNVRWTDVVMTSDYMADNPEDYINTLDNLNYQDYDSAKVELSAGTDTVMFELGGVTYSAEYSNWSAIINNLPLYRREGNDFYVYKYEITEVAADGVTIEDAGDGTGSGGRFTVTYEHSEDGKTTIIKNAVSEDAVELPHTGGIGTIIFYIFGTVLVLGSGAVLASRKSIKRSSGGQ